MPCGDPWVYDAYKLLPVTSKVLFIIRGLPGSGKSTLAKILSDAFHTEHWYEADMYFEGPEGYRYIPAHIGDAHDWCISKVIDAIKVDAPCIVVSNTFTKLWEFKAYKELAESKGYMVQVIECKGQFTSTHGVPVETITKMANRWEQYDGKVH